MSLHRGALFGRRLLASCTTGPLPLLPTSSFISSGARLKSTGTPVNMGVMFVPQQEAWLVERMGKFNTILEPGLNFLIPILDKVLPQKVWLTDLLLCICGLFTNPRNSSLMFFSWKVKYVQSLKEIAIDIPGQQVFFCLNFLKLEFTNPAGDLHGQCRH